MRLGDMSVVTQPLYSGSFSINAGILILGEQVDTQLC